MARRTPLAALALAAACGDQAFTTVQPEPFWVDAAGTPVTRGTDLEWIDDRGIVWPIDWRTATLSALPYPAIVYEDAACAGRAFLVADAPPLHALYDPDDDTYKIVREDARIERLDDGYAKVGGCSKVLDQPVVYDLRVVVELQGAPQLLPYVPPLRKVLPAGE